MLFRSPFSLVGDSCRTRSACCLESSLLFYALDVTNEHGYIFLSECMVDLGSPPTSLTEPGEPPKFTRVLVKSFHSLSLGFYVLVVDPVWIS